ncbi:Hypothetical protein FKW44_006137, partial [Caligus rogercresseyi]
KPCYLESLVLESDILTIHDISKRHSPDFSHGKFCLPLAKVETKRVEIARECNVSRETIQEGELQEIICHHLLGNWKCVLTANMTTKSIN